MPLNNEVGDEARPEEVQMAAAAMRALRENPTMVLNDAYRWGGVLHWTKFLFLSTQFLRTWLIFQIFFEQWCGSLDSIVNL